MVPYIDYRLLGLCHVCDHAVRDDEEDEVLWSVCHCWRIPGTIRDGRSEGKQAEIKQTQTSLLQQVSTFHFNFYQYLKTWFGSCWNLSVFMGNLHWLVSLSTLHVLPLGLASSVNLSTSATAALAFCSPSVSHTSTNFMEEQYELAGVADFNVPPVWNPIHRLNNFRIKQYPIQLLPSRDQYSSYFTDCKCSSDSIPCGSNKKHIM